MPHGSGSSLILKAWERGSQHAETVRSRNLGANRIEHPDRTRRQRLARGELSVDDAGALRLAGIGAAASVRQRGQTVAGLGRAGRDVP